MPITIRRATATDTDALVERRWEFRATLHGAVESHDAFVERCGVWMRDRLTTDSTWRCWVAVADAEIVGSIWVQLVEKIPNPNDDCERFGYVSSVYVSPELRGAGVGSMLLEEALAWCDAYPLDSVILWPSVKSRPLYERHGFREAATLMERRRPGSVDYNAR